MMRKARQGWVALRDYGPGWVLFRAKMALRHRLGAERRSMPMKPWPAAPPGWAEDASPLFTAPEAEAIRGFARRHPDAVRAVVAEAEEILQGRFRLFEGEPEQRGFPPAWNQEGAAPPQAAAGIHWSEVRPREDLKLLWELSRFGWAQILARAFAFTGDDRFAEAFWTLLEDWRRVNPPNQGPQWACGQEASLRMFALCLADALMSQAPASTPGRRAMLRVTVHALAGRIEPHIDYARSQRNNHALNEALGLATAGSLLPGAPESARWIRRGFEVFEADLLDQVDAEGSYIQHSTVYHRVLLHAGAWYLRLASRSGHAGNAAVLARLAAAGRWMQAMTDAETGAAPNLGSNDGANVFRCASTAFGDHRPAVQALCGLLGNALPYPEGPWDETLLWLGGASLEAYPRAVQPRSALHARGRGHFLRHTAGTSLYLRCAEYQDRPSQSDPLHLDLTWRGVNVLCDAGTYRYNAPAPWRNGLAATRVHNTLTLDGRDSMDRVGAFLWLHWDQAQLLSGPEDPHLIGERTPTPQSPLWHRRSAFPMGPEHWAVVDDAWSELQVPYRLHWLAPDFPHRPRPDGVDLETPAGTFTLRRLGPGKPGFFRAGTAPGLGTDRLRVEGWRSLRYNQLEPALAMVLSAPHGQPVRWITVMGPGPFEVQAEDLILHLEGPTGSWRQELPAPPYPP